MSDRPITIEVLGPMEARAGEREVALGGPKQRAVLAALLLRRGRVVPVDHLVDALWEDTPPRSAVTKLQGHVCALRKAVNDAAAVAERAGDPARASDLFGAALALWRGPAFSDVPAEAIRTASARLGEHRLAAAEDKADADLRLGRYRSVLDQVGALIEDHPLRDRLRELHMRALIHLDRGSEAVAFYRNWRLILHRELGVEPADRLRGLAQSIESRS